MEKPQIESEFHDNSYVMVKIPMKYIDGIINDINELFKNKKKDGCNIGATGATIDLREALVRAKEKVLFESMIVVRKLEKNK